MRLIPRGINQEDDREDPPCLCCFPSNEFGRRRRSNNENRIFVKITVLVAVALERLAFYSVASNLILFLNGTSYQWSSSEAMTASLFFLGASCVFYFIGGCVADLKCGRYRVIIVAFVIYVLGYVLFPFFSYWARDVPSSNDVNIPNNWYFKVCDVKTNNHKCVSFIYPALSLVAVGTGLLRANIAPFGADQVIRLSCMQVKINSTMNCQ